MSCDLHKNHPHEHKAGCGHIAIEHDGHIDYLHDGHLHHQTSDGDVSDHVLAVNEINPEMCTSNQVCSAHEKGHIHGPGCGHEAVPHGNHIDYLVDGHLHHPHGDHCDNHGPVTLAKVS